LYVEKNHPFYGLFYGSVGTTVLLIVGNLKGPFCLKAQAVEENAVAYYINVVTFLRKQKNSTPTQNLRVQARKYFKLKIYFFAFIFPKMFTLTMKIKLQKCTSL
jgi:hypothetical protein